jgi:hypothetical protein
MERTGRIIGYILAGLILAVALSFFVACGNDSGSDPQVIITDPSPPVVVDPDPDPIYGNIIIAFHVADETRFYNGQDVKVWKTGPAVSAGYRKICHGTVLYGLDQTGITTYEKNIIGVPDYAAADGDNIWLAWRIPPQEALDKGALYKDYLQVYYNATEYGHWYDRQYLAEDFFLAGSDVMAYGQTGGWRHINGVKTGLRVAIRDGFVVYDFNSTLRTAKIDGVNISWATNFFNGANFWLKSGSTWYSQNGYRWDGVTLTETGCALDDWRAEPYPITLEEAPVLISAGTRVEAGETCLYWIECNSGWVFRYVPSTNMNTAYVRIYNGDGFRDTGLAMASVLKPVINKDLLFFCFDDGMMYKTDLVLKTTAVLGVGAEWVVGW